MDRKSLLKNVLYNVFYKVLNVLFPIISIAYVSRVLAADGVGRVAAVNNNVSYFLIFATLGIPMYGVREIAKMGDNSNARDKVFSELFTINFIFSVVTYIFFNVLILNTNLVRSELELYKIFGLTLLLNIFNIDWLFQGIQEFGYIAFRSIIVKIISIMLLIVLVKNKEDIYIYSVIQVMASAGNGILSILTINRYVKFSLRNINIKKHIKPLCYLALVSISTELYAKMDITMLNIMKSDSIVGCYVNAQKIIDIIVITLVAITAVFMPRLSYLFDNNRNEFNKVLIAGFELMVFLSIPTCIGIMFISKALVLTFLGPGFIRSNCIVVILSPMIPLKCIGDLICYQVMMCAKKEKILMKSYFVIMLLNLLNNLLLIPKFSAYGAAFASVVSEVFAFAFVLYFSRAYFDLRGVKSMICKTFFCSSVMGMGIYCVEFIDFNANFYKLLLQIFVGCFIYLIMCYLTKHEVLYNYINILKMICKNKLVK